MNDPKILKLISKHISGEESMADKDELFFWMNQSKENADLFQKIKAIWENKKISDSPAEEITLTLREKFTKKRIKTFLINKALGNLIGFIVGMWITTLFSHYTMERRGLSNLFGLVKRKKIVVNDIPDWMQGALAIGIGFIALELINHFFHIKKHLHFWEFLKRNYSLLKLNFLNRHK